MFRDRGVPGPTSDCRCFETGGSLGRRVKCRRVPQPRWVGAKGSIGRGPFGSKGRTIRPSHIWCSTEGIGRFYYNIMSAFRDRGVPGPTSKLSPRAPAQMGRRETEREGGRQPEGDGRERWKSCGLRVCPAPRSGALAVGGYKRPRGREREAYARRPGPPRGQPSRTSALGLPFIGVRRGPRCTIGDVAVC